jgi:hypothetical protein
MIVVAIPRSGATRICMDLAEKHNIKFLGEMSPRNLENELRLRKDLTHETKFEIKVTPEEYCKSIERDPNYICLANYPGANLLTSDADYVVMRKNLKDCLYSWLNYVIKGGRLNGNDGVAKIEAFFMLKMLLDTAYGVITYCLHNDKEIIWYEDYFPGMDTRYSHIPDNWLKKLDMVCDQYHFVFNAHNELVKRYSV